MNLRSFLLYIPLLCISLASAGQYYESGQDPASLKWMQIKTPSFRVIYPEGYGEQGVAFARALQDATSKLTGLFPGKKFTIPVIIHNYTTQSNGYVSWAPRRMELYPTPEQNAIPLDPNTQLAIHEVTHALQMQSLRTGFTKAMSVAFGEQFTGIVSAMLPLWYLEGDAVYAETILTQSGRGRSPSFQKQLKAIVTDKKIYNFEKMINGSFRDFIPDHYQVGYQMVAWAGLKYDHVLWNRMISFTGKYPFTVIPNNISLLKSANLTRKRLYSKTFADLKNIWEEDISGSGYLTYAKLSPDKRGNYINYHSPVLAGNDSIVSIKTSLKKPPSFVLIRPSLGRSETRIFKPGSMYPWYMSAAKGKVVWVEDQPDPRWENRNFSVIKILDIKTGRSERLTRRSRYLSAAISPDGKIVASIENTVENNNNVVLIDPVNGSEIKSVPVPENAYLQRPQWSGDGSEITFISLTSRGEGILSYSPSENEWRTLIEPSNNDLQSSFLRNDTLFFVSSSSGTDNLYIKTPDERILPVTNSKFGISDIIITGSQAIFADYLVLGNTICQADLKGSVKKSGLIPDSSSFLISSFNKTSPEPAVPTGDTLTPGPYRKWQHLFNFHSWMPFYADLQHIQADPAAVRPGLTIMSQNHLSTLISTLGYEYSADRRHKFHSRVTWQGWYPVIESQLDYGDAPLISSIGATTIDPRIPQQGVRFRNSASIPLSFRTGRFSQFLSPWFTVDYRNRYIYRKETNFYDFGQTQLSTRLYFSNVHRPAARDIYPAWAQVVDLNYAFSPFDKQVFGWSGSAKLAFFLPGFLSNNSTRIRFEKENQEWEMFITGNNIHMPRGYTGLFSKELTFFSIDYTMPLLYPDLNIPGFLYIKRIRGSVFYDAARARGTAHFNQSGLDRINESHELFNSYGFELLSDFHLLRNPFMISAGIQGAWPDTDRRPVFEFVLNIDIFGMTIGRSGL